MITIDNQLELRHLRSFAILAGELHYRKAAEKLFISQPALSKQIQVLEKVLGYQLFKRHNRKVELTPSGRYLYPEVRTLFSNLETSLNHSRMVNEGIGGRLRFGYLGSAMQSVIPELLVKIRKTYSEVKFDLREMDNTSQIEAILNEEIDIGFVRLDQAPRGTAMNPIFKEKFSLVLPLNHHLNSDNFKNLKDLKEESFILFDPSYSESYFNKLMKLFDRSGFAPNVTHKTVHAITIFRLVENHFGISIIPTSLKSGVNMKVKFIELNKTSLDTTLQMIWKKNTSNPILKNILELVGN